MSGERDVDQLREVLRGELARRLTSSGWTLLERRAPNCIEIAEFTCAIDSEFSATASMRSDRSVLNTPPLVISEVLVGVAYEPLRRLWPLLGDPLRFACS